MKHFLAVSYTHLENVACGAGEEKQHAVWGNGNPDDRIDIVVFPVDGFWLSLIHILKNLRFGCYVNRYEEIAPFLELLEATENIHVKSNGNTIIFYK